MVKMHNTVNQKLTSVLSWLLWYCSFLGVCDVAICKDAYCILSPESVFTSIEKFANAFKAGSNVKTTVTGQVPDSDI